MLRPSLCALLMWESLVPALLSLSSLLLQYAQRSSPSATNASLSPHRFLAPTPLPAGLVQCNASGATSYGYDPAIPNQLTLSASSLCAFILEAPANLASDPTTVVYTVNVNDNNTVTSLVSSLSVAGNTVDLQSFPDGTLAATVTLQGGMTFTSILTSASDVTHGFAGRKLMGLPNPLVVVASCRLSDILDAVNEHEEVSFTSCKNSASCAYGTILD